MVDLWGSMLTNRVRLSLAAGVAHQSRLCGLLEFLEPSRQPVSIRVILTSSRQLDRLLGDSLEAEFEKCAIMDFQQPVGDVNAKIRVDPNVGRQRPRDGAS